MTATSFTTQMTSQMALEVKTLTIFFFPVYIFFCKSYLLEFTLLTTVLDYIYHHLGHELRYRVKQTAVMKETQFPPKAFRGSSKILWPVSTVATGSWAG